MHSIIEKYRRQAVPLLGHVAKIVPKDLGTQSLSLHGWRSLLADSLENSQDV